MPFLFVENPDYHPEGDYALTPEDKVIFDVPKLTYANIAKLHPKLFANCQPDSLPSLNYLLRLFLDIPLAEELSIRRNASMWEPQEN
ncbi:hypothetical protein [Coxiella-like endosymbiont of Rhipicephalus sanguineus]|uniref:hypothetical protein n=1 Tax=Coxiella-like endosymbiont of Rhipicephalus sanguineus TaxID=1955402 RepID=UPI00203CCD6B|nr:hypothetical protein [Coxiella-like endosymbiont of Rhipicephalus sanguineus]